MEVNWPEGVTTRRLGISQNWPCKFVAIEIIALLVRIAHAINFLARFFDMLRRSMHTRCRIGEKLVVHFHVGLFGPKKAFMPGLNGPLARIAVFRDIFAEPTEMMPHPFRQVG